MHYTRTHLHGRHAGIHVIKKAEVHEQKPDRGRAHRANRQPWLDQIISGVCGVPPCKEGEGAYGVSRWQRGGNFGNERGQTNKNQASASLNEFGKGNGRPR